MKLPYKCPECSKRFEKPIIDDMEISGEFAFHLHDTHGVTIDMLQHYIANANKELKEFNARRQSS